MEKRDCRDRTEVSRKYYLKNKEKIIERVHLYRKKNREEIRRKARNKYATDEDLKEKAKQYQKEYRKNNKDKINAYHRKYYTTVGREKHNELKRIWGKTPKGKLKSQRSSYKRRSILKEIGKHTVEEWETIVKLYNSKCAICKEEKKLTKDHIIPLSKGGMNTIDNLQPLCRGCNAKKGNKL